MNAKKMLKDAIRHCDNLVSQKSQYQVLDKNSPNYGGLFDEELGFCCAGHVDTAQLLYYMGLSYCSKESKYFNDPEVYEKILIAIKFIESQQRESGFIDLRDRNYDSPCDTAFAVGLMCPIAWMCKNISGIEKADELYEVLRPFVERATFSIADHGGFHTPNHRWIIMGAMCAANEMYPNLDCKDAIDMYLKEGIDLNEDGTYSEKSILYSAEINQKLIDAYYFLKSDYILENIVKNCRCIIDFMNNDTSILTAISIRQDNGKHVFPTAFLPTFYFAAKHSGDMRLFSAIDKIRKKNSVTSVGLIYLFARNPEWLNDDFETLEFKQPETKLMADTGVWIYRRDELDVYLIKGVTSQMCVRYGDLFIKGIKLFAPYFNEATYLGRELVETENGVKMFIRPTYGPEQRIYMPGYWKPLGRPVSFEELPYHNLKDRIPSPRPDIEYVFEIEKTDDGIDLTVTSNGGLEGVRMAMQFDFELPGSVITENTYEQVSTPRSIILTDGYLTYRKGIYSAKIGPGFFEHNWISKNPSDFIVNMTATLPVKKTIHISFEKVNNEDIPKYVIQGEN